MSRRDAVRKHIMPFGAEVVPGGVRFRLWAPSAQGIELLLAGRSGVGETVRPMTRGDGGWFELEAAGAGAGDRYRFRVDGDLAVPDPASRHQPEDVHGPSQVVDPEAFSWSDAEWKGRPWEETVLYELHVGAFTPEGTFNAVRGKLDHLKSAGVTAVELMPVSDFPGRRNWGYDGVLPFAPDAVYGRPEDLKRLVEAAHERGLMVFLDVVYNHFGPEGNYLHRYAGRFFDPSHPTPWGDAINFTGPGSEVVRSFFIHNALYWLEEFHLDGLRLDAVHAMRDDSDPSFLDDLARAVAAGPGSRRHVHLVLENYANETRPLERNTDGTPLRYTAQWNDDVHHALHCLLTGEAEGYYGDFAPDPLRYLGRGLAEGFAWQGEPSPYRGASRGEVSAHLPPVAFVNFLQNHDQIGNRPFGDRLTTLVPEAALEAALAVLLLAPSPPLFFMGEEFACRRPFPFFCDFGPDLARAVTEGRRREFKRFARFNDPAVRARIPDPNAAGTFAAAVLDWDAAAGETGRRRLSRVRDLLELRRREIVPRLAGTGGHAGRFRLHDCGVLEVDWTLGDGSRLALLARPGGEGEGPAMAPPPGRVLAATHPEEPGAAGLLRPVPWSVRWSLVEAATP